MIESTSNKRVKEIAALQRRTEERETKRSFVIEGERLFFDTWNDDRDAVGAIYVTEAFEAEKKAKLSEYGVETYETVSDGVMKAMSDTVNPQGILAVAKMPRWELSAIMDSDAEPGLRLVLDGVRDPGNMGTIFRTALAAGVKGLLLSADCVDVFNPKVVRATMSAVYRMPFVVCADMTGVLRTAQEQGARVLSAAVDETAQPYWEADLRSPCFVILGNEANGVSQDLRVLSDARVLIPMEGGMESLNVAAAGAVLMYEAFRQNRQV